MSHHHHQNVQRGLNNALLLGPAAAPASASNSVGWPTHGDWLCVLS